jgi:hypothetical protein
MKSCVSCKKSSSSSSSSSGTKNINELIKLYGNVQDKNSDEKIELVYDKVYSAVESINQLKTTNISFLEGKLFCTPTHLGPIDIETRIVLNNLIQINKKGFISTEGQPSTNQENVYTSNDNEIIFQQQQKSYINGFINKTHKNKFLNLLKNNTDFYYMIEDYINDEPVIIDKNFPSTRYNVTRYRESNRNTINNTPWVEFTNIHSNSPENIVQLYHYFPKIVELIKTKLLYVTIAYNKWPNEVKNQRNAEDILLKLFS